VYLHGKGLYRHVSTVSKFIKSAHTQTQNSRNLKDMCISYSQYSHSWNISSQDETAGQVLVVLDEELVVSSPWGHLWVNTRDGLCKMRCDFEVKPSIVGIFCYFIPWLQHVETCI
jgi:hypothetical protein